MFSAASSFHSSMRPSPAVASQLELSSAALESPSAEMMAAALLLLSLFHHKSGCLRFLLNHLFGFYCLCELPECHMCQGHVIKDEPKCCCSLCEAIALLSGDQLSLSNQFSSIKASHHRLEDLCGDEQQHPLIIVLANAAVDMRKLAGHWPEQDVQCDVDFLQVFATSDDQYIPWWRVAAKDNWFLYPRDEKVNPFPYHNVLYATESIGQR